MNGSVARELPVASALLIRRELAQFRSFVLLADALIEHGGDACIPRNDDGLPKALHGEARLRGFQHGQSRIGAGDFYAEKMRTVICARRRKHDRLSSSVDAHLSALRGVAEGPVDERSARTTIAPDRERVWMTRWGEKNAGRSAVANALPGAR